MKIRRLYENENAKLDALQSIAYGFSFDLKKADEDGLEDEVYGAFLDDDKTLIASIFAHRRDSFFCGHALPALGVGGVATLPEYRRRGAVKAIFREMFRAAPENGWATTYLFPFSYAYYRMFGYERLDMSLSIKLPNTALETFERSTSARLYMGDKRMQKDILHIYNTYAANYNMMFSRDEDCESWSDEPHKSRKWTYVWYDDAGIARAYATVRLEDGEGRLDIRELCYTDAVGLRGIIGFLRMFDGQAREYRFSDLPQSSELDLLLRRYVDVEYGLHSSTMGRVLLVQKLLELNAYPEGKGAFRLRCDDSLEWNRAVWEVEYQNGKAQVKKLPYDSPFDLAAEMPALSRIMLCGGCDITEAGYLEGLKLTPNADNVLKAFPKRRVHLQDHF